jgi:nucleotide-binding universal stress UspA family protein
MRRRAPSPRLEVAASGGGPTGTATVVVGIVGFSMSLAAFRWGCREARRLGGRTVAVVISPAAPGGVVAALPAVAGSVTVGYMVPDSAADERVEDLAAKLLHEAVGLELAIVYSHGRPAAELLRIAAEVRADLVVVGGPASVGRHLVGRRRPPVIVVVPPK